MALTKLASWNINGIRAAWGKGLGDWIKQEKAHLYAFQETKALATQLSPEIAPAKGMTAHYASAKKLGYSGTSVWVSDKLGATEVTLGLGIPKFDDEGRTTIVKTPDFILYNCYFPNGQRDHNRVPYKLDYCKQVAAHALKEKKRSKLPVIITGDYNTAHHPIDLANPKQNEKTTGFLPNERAWMDEFESQGFVDLFRHQNPDKEGEYTWWTYRNDCRGRNIGWRIDYFFATKDLLPALKRCSHRPEVLGSDHCPVVLELSL
jgi:exodeoxyribonuclease-3